MSVPATMPAKRSLQNLEVRPSDENWAHESGFPVGIYIRVSSDSDLQKTSLGNQEKAVREWCRGSGHAYQVHDVYVDDARSGAYMENRTEVKRLLADARAGKIRGIVTKEISRVSRDVYDTLSIKRSLEQVGACYIDIIHGYDSRKDGDELFLVMYGVIAQKERKTTGRRVAMTMTQKAKEGRNPCLRPAFGYCKRDKDFLEPDPESAPVYREIIARWLGGSGKKKICTWLNDAGIRTGLGRSWTAPSLTVVLRNPVYLGHTYWATTRIVKGGNGRAKVVARPQNEWVCRENTHPPLLDRTTWDAVQALLDSRSAEHGASKHRFKVTKTYPLVGYLYCGMCGSKLYGHKFTKRPKKRPVYHNYYYVCFQQHGSCNLPYQRREVLEEHVNRRILEIVADPEIMRAHVARNAYQVMEGLDELRQRRSVLAAELERLAEGIKRLGVDRVMGAVTEREFAEQMSVIRPLREEKEAELARLDKQLAQVDGADAMVDRIVAAIKDFVLPQDPRETNEAMEQLYFLLLQRIVVLGNGELDIKWAFAPFEPTPGDPGGRQQWVRS